MDNETGDKNMANNESVLALEREKLRIEETLRREIINFAKKKFGTLLSREELMIENKQKFSAAFSDSFNLTPIECVKFHAMCGCDDCKDALERSGVKVNRIYGLVKGQHVTRHSRIDHRTGQRFVAGGKASGSAESVMAEGRTSAPAGGGGKPSTGNHAMSKVPTIDGPGSDSGSNLAGDLMEKEGTIYDPDTLETVIRNLENAKVADLQQMVNDLFTQQRCMQRGIIAELILKEIMRRGLVDKSESEKQMDDVKAQGNQMQMKAKEDQAKAKAKESADKSKSEPGSATKAA